MSEPVFRAGESFNYAVWTAGTTVTLCNVPWSNDYRDVVWYDNDVALDKYLNENAGPTTVISNTRYLRVGEPIRIPIPFNNAYKFNYLRVTNPQQPVGENGPRTFYYFIQDVRHIAPNTTELVVQLDVWQSFVRHVNFGSAFVVRGHAGIADKYSDMLNGRYLLIQPEGFDLGNEYTIEQTYNYELGTVSGTNSCDIIILSSTRLHGPWGDIKNPQLAAAIGNTAEQLPNGCNAYWFGSISEFSSFMGDLSQAPWVAQGIVSIMAVPANIASSVNSLSYSGPNGIVGTLHELTDVDTQKSITLARNWKDDLQGDSLNDRYKNLKKFYTYPYTFIELTTFSGLPLVLKPESMTGPHITVQMLAHLAQPNPRVSFLPAEYNKGTYSNAEYSGAAVDDGGEFLDMQTGILNFPQFSVVNNGYMQVIAAQAHRLAYQHDSAQWSQQRAITGAQLGYDQATQSIGFNSRMSEINNSQTLGNAALGVASSMARGAGEGSVIGGAAGAMGGAAMGAANAAEGAGHAAIDIMANRRRTSAQNDLSGYMRDTNQNYASFAARGDYANTIAGITARVQDAKLTQPTTAGQVAGDAFNLATYGWVLSARVKMVNRAVRNVIGDYWLRFGYAVNRWVYGLPANLQCMENFTYWQLQELSLRSSECPEMYRQTIRGIMEKGVTVWNDANKIGRIDIARNEPITGSYFVAF